MLRHSTSQSISASDPTWLGLAETLMAVVLLLAICLVRETLIFAAVPFVLAPIMLMRTEESCPYQKFYPDPIQANGVVDRPVSLPRIPSGRILGESSR